MTCHVLEELKKGAYILCQDGPDADLLDTIPDDLDMAKFQRGQQFFRKYLFGCQRGMFLSLIIGLSVEKLLDVLVVTGQSSDPYNSFKRYLYTFLHVLRWHYGNMWEKNSSARKSLMYVRLRHSKARKIMEKDRENVQNNVGSVSEIHSNGGDNEKVNNEKSDMLLEPGSKGVCCLSPINKENYITQYDMALVQAGFIGTIILYPNHCGIKCTKSELNDFVYLWRWIGYALGISDQFNICAGGYEKAYSICKAIEMDIVLPSLRNPPKNFEHMANALLEGTKIASQRYLKFQLKPIIAHAFERSGSPVPFSLTFCERWYMLFESMFSYALIYIPGLAPFLSRCIEKLFRCNEMT